MLFLGRLCVEPIKPPVTRGVEMGAAVSGKKQIFEYVDKNRRRPHLLHQQFGEVPRALSGLGYHGPAGACV